jgi:hypothetical protein
MAADPLLDRDLALAASTDLRAIGRPLLREVIDFGVGAFRRCSATATGLDTPVGILFPFLHVLEMLDGTEVLLDSAAGVPARVTLRGAFEALLACEYVAKEDSERRGAAYVVTETNSRLLNLDRFDPDSDRGKAFRADLQRDDVGRGIRIPSFEDLPRKRAELAGVLAEAHLAEAAAEYDRIKRRGGKAPPFHALWGGPGDLEQLARRLERSSYYEILYRPWSKTAHASDLGRQLTEIEGAAAIRTIRLGSDLSDGYAHSVDIGLTAIRVLLTKYRPDELSNYWRWYKEKISSGCTSLSPRPRTDV